MASKFTASLVGGNVSYSTARASRGRFRPLLGVTQIPGGITCWFPFPYLLFHSDSPNFTAAFLRRGLVENINKTKIQQQQQQQQRNNNKTVNETKKHTERTTRTDSRMFIPLASCGVWRIFLFFSFFLFKPATAATTIKQRQQQQQQQLVELVYDE